MKFTINIVIMFSLCFMFLFALVCASKIKRHYFEHHYDGVKFRCDYNYSVPLKSWLKFHFVPATWHDARLICTHEGSMLASPITKQMRGEMRKLFKIKDRIFTGLHATYSKGKYFTVDGIPLDAIPQRWEHHEPDNKNNNENCLAMDGGGLLSDVNCGRPLPFICVRKEAAPITACGTHDTNYIHDIRTNHCYKFHTTPRNFSRAFLVCSAEGGHLAIVNSDVEAQVLVNVFSKYPTSSMIGPFWKDLAVIGYLTRQEGGDWRTIHGKTLREAGYEKWAANEPDNREGNEYCGSIDRTGLLRDVACDFDYAFICEKSPHYPAYCSRSPGILAVSQPKLELPPKNNLKKKKKLTPETNSVLQLRGMAKIKQCMIDAYKKNMDETEANQAANEMFPHFVSAVEALIKEHGQGYAERYIQFYIFLFCKHLLPDSGQTQRWPGIPVHPYTTSL